MIWWSTLKATALNSMLIIIKIWRLASTSLTMIFSLKLKTMLGRVFTHTLNLMELMLISRTDQTTGVNAQLSKKTQDVPLETTEKTRLAHLDLKMFLFMNLATMPQISLSITQPQELVIIHGAWILTISRQLKEVSQAWLQVQHFGMDPILMWDTALITTWSPSLDIWLTKLVLAICLVIHPFWKS